MKKNFLLFAISLVLLSSCSPRISTSISKSLAPLDQTQDVKIYEFLREVPSNAELLGRIDVGDSGFTTNCGYSVMLNLILQEARKIGGNTVCITNHLEPTIMSSCHQMAANIYYLSPTALSSNELKPNQAIDSLPNSNVLAKKDTIEIFKKGLGNTFTYKGEDLSLSQIKNLLRENPNSYALYQSAKGTSDFANLIAYIGGFCLGYGLGTAIREPEIGLKLAGVGCGILVVALPIVKSAENKLKKAVIVYNADTKENAYIPPYKLQLAATTNGVGLVIKF